MSLPLCINDPSTECLIDVRGTVEKEKTKKHRRKGARGGAWCERAAAFYSSSYRSRATTENASHLTTTLGSTASNFYAQRPVGSALFSTQQDGRRAWHSIHLISKSNETTQTRTSSQAFHLSHRACCRAPQIAAVNLHFYVSTGKSETRLGSTHVPPCWRMRSSTSFLSSASPPLAACFRFPSCVDFDHQASTLIPSPPAMWA